MTDLFSKPCVWPIAGLALSTLAFAQSPAAFAKPVLVKAGDANMGEARLFPSPMVHDVDGDGQLDVVVGDLQGHITVAKGARKNGKLTFGAETKMMGVDGEALDFANW